MKKVPEISVSANTIAAQLRKHHEKYGDLSGLSLKKIGDVLKKTMSVMFPHYAVASDESLSLEEHIKLLEEAFYGIVEPLCRDKDVGCSRLLVQRFLSDLPEIADKCHMDAAALVEGDPAATSVEEVILCYPGFYAVAAYRVANRLYQRGVPLLPRMITEYAHQKTGIDIHPGATIGHSMFIDHGTGVVIGETAVIGNNVKIYQGVTLGALRVDREARKKKRHPTIEDNVVIYSGATILGGSTVVGKNSVIGGNVWITRSVPEASRVMFKPTDNDEIVSIQARTGSASKSN
ncbi:serine O-acetyltransferase EpsC [Kordiimonas pumila]|uniref:Serine acetyltransferase n=1 Tax=Kordiimonas pumila TaxID=2161677 RepID=A0ABV7D520_9PROT|nr:serine O-acetyltransferase EpsC [Kordiimonas pumila]